MINPNLIIIIIIIYYYFNTNMMIETKFVSFLEKLMAVVYLQPIRYFTAIAEIKGEYSNAQPIAVVKFINYYYLPTIVNLKYYYYYYYCCCCY